MLLTVSLAKSQQGQSILYMEQNAFILLDEFSGILNTASFIKGGCLHCVGTVIAVGSKQPL